MTPITNESLPKDTLLTRAALIGDAR